MGQGHQEKPEFVGDVAVLPCRLCGELSEFAYEYPQMGGHQVCSRCAETVANVWYKRHGGSYLTWPNERRATDRYIKKDIPESLRWAVFERDDFRCKHCGSRRTLRADHVIPESAGGETSLENLQTLCHSCNSKKGKRTPK